MVVVLLAMLPAIVIAGGTALHVSQAFVSRDDAEQLEGARTLARSFGRAIEMLSRAVGAAITAEDEGPGVPSRHHAIAALLGGLRVDGALWVGRAGASPAVEPIAGSDFTHGPALDAAVGRVAATGRMELVALPGATDGRGPEVVALSRLSGDPALVRVLQLGFGPARVAEMLSRGDLRSGTVVRLIPPEGATGGSRGAAMGPDEFFAALPAATDGPDAGTLDVDGPGGTPYLLAYATVPQASGWRVVLLAVASARTLAWVVPLSEFALAVVASLLLALVCVTWLGTRLTRPLSALTLDASTLAANGDLTPGQALASSVLEFNELRMSLGRSTAVLRRRAAAERMALKEARTGHELLASVVTATEDLIYVKNLDLRLLLANRATLSVGGVNREEWQVLGRGIEELLPHEAAVREEALDRRVLAGAESDSMRLDWSGADGVMRCFMLTKSVWRDASQRITGVVTVAHDVTEQRAAQARLAAVQADLLRVSRLSAMGAMASGLAHELNQPLAAATNYLNAASRLLATPLADTGALQARADRMARTAVVDAADQMLRAGDIVRRLRAFIGRGEASLRSEDIGDVIREACELARADGAARNADLGASVTGVGEMVLVDRTQLQQVLLNLIRNAAEAAEAPGGSRAGEGGAPSPIRIEVGFGRLNDGRVRITVADNGPGLPPEVVRRLFEPFVSTKRDGMGIGLAICRTIVEGHGGRLSAEERAGGGTVFRIMLPAAPADLNIDVDAVRAA